MMPNVPWKRNGPLTFLFIIVSFAARLQKVSSGGIAEVYLQSFTNQNGLLDSGVCCDKVGIGFLSTCELNGGCDTYFVVCIDLPTNTGLNDLTNCTFGYQSTELTADTASIVFGSTIGGGLLTTSTPNPLTFSFTSWPIQVLVKVQAWDADLGFSPQKIDFLESNPLSITPAGALATWTDVTLQNRTTMNLRVRVRCGLNYYGAQCNILCSPSSKYTCGSDGLKQCSAGWAGANCDQPASAGGGDQPTVGGGDQPTVGSVDQVTAADVQQVTTADCGVCQNNGLCIGGSCSCAPGYTGVNCETDIDECIGISCNGGTCDDGINQFTCLCPSGYTGTTCDQTMSRCLINPCLNGGVCEQSGIDISCRCAAGWTGSLCALDIDECSNNVCRNSRACQNTNGGFVCTCLAGWTGQLCDVNINDCSPNPCGNGGTCTDGVNSFTCRCTSGFTPVSNCFSPAAPPSILTEKPVIAPTPYQKDGTERNRVLKFGQRLTKEQIWLILTWISNSVTALDSGQSTSTAFVYYQVIYYNAQSSGVEQTLLLYRVTRGGQAITSNDFYSGIEKEVSSQSSQSSFLSEGDEKDFESEIDAIAAGQTGEMLTPMSELRRRLDVGAIIVISFIIAGLIIGTLVIFICRQRKQKWEIDSQTMDPIQTQEMKEVTTEACGGISGPDDDNKVNSAQLTIDCGETQQTTSPNIYVITKHKHGHHHHHHHSRSGSSSSSSSSGSRSIYDQIREGR